MRGKIKKKTVGVSFVLISLMLASIFVGTVSVAGAGELADGAEENKNPLQAEKGNGAVSDVNVTASSTTCNSCSDCTNKLNGKYDTVKLTRDLVNVKGSCITFGASNVIFDGNGHKIDGDDTGEFESGIMMSSKSGNTIKNCVITDFESGITLYGSSKNKIYDNEVSSNYYDGIWISTNSDSNNIHANRIEDNGKYGVYFSSDSNNNIFSKNVVCSNPTDIHDDDKNSGDDNMCDTAHNWNDDGTNGCTYSCPAEKPDLLITEITCDSANDRIGYKIKNVGDVTASKGHYTTLFIDGAFKIKEQVNVNLAPGASSQRYFDYYSWKCTPPRDTVKVCADYGDFVDESNEQNNCREETCECVVEKPDLVITDIWNVSNTIYYKVKNQGKATAGVSYTSLSIDGVFKVKDYVAPLASGATRTESFNYQWACTPPGDIVKVCADYLHGVAESNEKNNCRNETWKCDNTPPVIISGPTVSEITQSSVTISWTTNEDSDSLVRFDRTAGKYEEQKFSLKLKQEHKVILTNLLPSTTYHYVVQSTDASNNTVVSRDGLFETGPVPDDEPPVISSLNISRGKGDFLYYEMSADASDNVGVERVEFYMDDELIGTDYSAPYQCYMTPASIGMTWAEFLEEHTIEAVALDRCLAEARLPRFFDPPYECEHIGMEMRQPHSDFTIYIEGDTVPAGTIVPIEVYAALEQEHCYCAEWSRDAYGMDRCVRFSSTTTLFPVSKVEFYVNHAPIPNTSSGYVYTGNWDASGFPIGTHVIRVDAIASEDCKQTIIRDVSVVRGEPSLNLDRTVTRVGNYFRVELTLSNDGTVSTPYFDRILDNTIGFQPLRGTGHAGPYDYEVTSDCSPDGRSCEVAIDLSLGAGEIRLGPGESITVEYLVVPVLYTLSAAIDVDDCTIGMEDVRVVNYWDIEIERFERPWDPHGAVWDAMAASDYLIITNPERLFDLNPADDVNDLLSAMAELSQHKNGVLGYLFPSSLSNPDVVDNYIEDWGFYLKGSDPGDTVGDYRSNGYLLIVGETEIVPSRAISDTGIRDATNHWTGGPVYPVTCVDNTYADISGDDNLPELIVARIIGDSANQLMTPIETSLLDQFERTDAFVISGTGGGQSSFETNADEVAGIVDDEFTVDLMHGGDWGSDTQRRIQFTTRARDKDVLFYRDHGSIGCWSHTICTWNFPVNFGNSYPFAFGSVCLSGHFEGSYCIGEAFLDSGAGVYLGATEGSPRDANNAAGKKFFNKWIDSPKSLGQAFKETKRELGTSDVYKRLWVLEYNLYGDPKYGSSSASDSADSLFSSATPLQKASWQPLSSLEVTVPDYEVTTIDGQDHVEIPGGQLLLVPDEPMVPYYVTSVDYARGYEVDDVVLTERSGLTIATGLNLPTVSMDKGGDGSEKLETLLESTDAEWYPEKEYRWQIIENPDGSTTLLIIMYPFYYNSLTTDVKFYRNYTFEINYTKSTVEIAALTTDRDAYQQGDDVLVYLWLNNSGNAQDVIVEALVKRCGSGEIASGLLLQSLKDFAGHASFSPQWDSSGIEPGYYFVEVTLKDTSGNVLDRRTEMFRLGISSGEITSFTTTPEYFDIGDDININMTFNNTGTANITGTAITKIKNSTGYVTEEFRHSVTCLLPSESISFSDTWNTSGAEESSYNIIGYVLFDSTTAEPVSVTVNTQAKIFDTGPGTYPSVMGNHTGIIKLNQPITVSTLYTYPCAGTAGHTEYARISNASWSIETQPWEGYIGDWQNLSFTGSFTLYANETYDYVIHTGSYPQIIHNETVTNAYGTMKCMGFVDVNGKRYNDWIPAIRLE